MGKVSHFPLEKRKLPVTLYISQVIKKFSRIEKLWAPSSSEMFFLGCHS